MGKNTYAKYSGYKVGIDDSNYRGRTGTGGLLVIMSNSIENNGAIVSKGISNGTSIPASGGSSGGGSINLFYRETIKEGTINAIGGNGGYGGYGGNGCVTTGNISSGAFIKDE